MLPIIGNFRILRPNYEISQEAGLNWISRAHAYSKYLENSYFTNKKTLAELNSLMESFTKRFGCKTDKIVNRGSCIRDYLHTNWDEMQFFDLKKNNSGALVQERMHFFSEIATQVFNKFYSEIESPPKNMLHVTCTGYSSPSSAQLLVSNKGWGNITKVTHAYHMGCYAALPSLRMGHGFLLQEKQLSINAKENPLSNRVDIIHTEMCTLHFNPSLHDPSQFIVQSLFSDGFICYSLYDTNTFYLSECINGFEVLVNHETILSHCSDSMSWDLFDYGFQMKLSGKVPSIIAENIENFINKMFENIDSLFAEIKENIIFAIHPGGPKIIHFIRDILGLSSESILFSENILRMFGNMSSATLPHIWEAILKSQPQKGALVVSLAFGPGLTISGSIMRVV
jgi:predicted naringenin-chalcone synthase